MRACREPCDDTSRTRVAMPSPAREHGTRGVSPHHGCRGGYTSLAHPGLPLVPYNRCSNGFTRMPVSMRSRTSSTISALASSVIGRLNPVRASNAAVRALDSNVARMHSATGSLISSGHRTDSDGSGGGAGGGGATVGDSMAGLAGGGCGGVGGSTAVGTVGGGGGGGGEEEEADDDDADVVSCCEDESCCTGTAGSDSMRLYRKLTRCQSLALAVASAAAALTASPPRASCTTCETSSSRSHAKVHMQCSLSSDT